MSTSQKNVSEHVGGVSEERGKAESRKRIGRSDKDEERVEKKRKERRQKKEAPKYDADDIVDFFEQRGKWAKKEEEKKVEEMVVEEKKKKEVEKVEGKKKKVAFVEEKEKVKPTRTMAEFLASITTPMQPARGFPARPPRFKIPILPEVAQMTTVKKPPHLKAINISEPEGSGPIPFPSFSPSPPRPANNAASPPPITRRSIADRQKLQKTQPVKISDAVPPAQKAAPKAPEVVALDKIVIEKEREPKRTEVQNKQQKEKEMEKPKTKAENQKTTVTGSSSHLEREIGGVTDEILSVAARGRVEQQLTIDLLKGTKTTLSAVIRAVSTVPAPRLPDLSLVPPTTNYCLLNYGSRYEFSDSSTSDLVSRILGLHGLKCSPGSIRLIEKHYVMPRLGPTRYFRSFALEPSISRELNAILARKDVVFQHAPEHPTDFTWIRREMLYEEVLRFEILRIAAEKIIPSLPIPLRNAVSFNDGFLSHPDPYNSNRTVSLTVQDIVNSPMFQVCKQLNKPARFVYYGIFGKKE